MPAHAPPASNYIGENICAARHAYNHGAGMTQLELAHAIGLIGPDAGAHISRYESGKAAPKLSSLLRIADALGVSIHTLLTVRTKK